MLRLRYGVHIHYAAENLDLEFRGEEVTGDLDEETIHVMWQLKPWESMGLDRKQGEKEEKRTRKNT